MRITRKGYYEVYDPDGNYISRHTSRDESYEAVTENGQEGIYTITCPNREVEVLLGIVNQGGGGAPAPSGSYTATHYVAPFASVAGATSDEDAQNEAAFDASYQDSGSPCTLACAMLYATEGEQVQCAPGVYISLASDVEGISNFNPSNSGTSGNEIVFFAENPGAYNSGNTALMSELRTLVDGNEGGIIGTGNQDYIILDGFYVDESISPSNDGYGHVLINVSTGCSVRRFFFDRTDATYSGQGVNAPNIRLHSTYNCTVYDNYSIGNNTVADDNSPMIELYWSDSPVIAHNKMIGTGCGIFNKAENTHTAPHLTNVIIRNNWIENCALGGIKTQTSHSTYIYDNLICNMTGDCIRLESVYVGNEIDIPVWIYRNTLHITGGFDKHCLMIQGHRTDSSQQSEIYDNIFYNDGGTNLVHAFPVDSGYADFGNFNTVNYNCWFDVDTSPTWRINAEGAGEVDYTSFAEWQGYIDDFGNDSTSQVYEFYSIYSDPEFVNAAGDDFTLDSNGQDALTASSIGGPVGCYITGSEEIGLRASPTY